MGNQVSTANAISTIVNRSVTNVLINNSSNCGQNNNSVQTIDLSNITAKNCKVNISGISQVSIQKPNFTCLSDSVTNTSLITQLKAELKQQAQAKVSGIGGALNSEATSNIISNTTNEIVNNINITNVASCVQSNIASQDFSLHGVTVTCPEFCNTGCPTGNTCDSSLCVFNISDINQKIVNEAVANCISKNTNVNNIINDAAAKVTQEAASSNTGISLPDIIGAIVASIVLVILCISCFVGLYYVFQQNQDKK